ATSPMFVSGDAGTHVVTHLTLLDAQRMDTERVPLKEESQRFASTHDDVEISGGIGPEASGKIAFTLGGEKGCLGKPGLWAEFGGWLEGGLSANRGHRKSLTPNEGSGEVRG